MAKNQVFDRGEKLSLPVADGVVSGDPVRIGAMTGVAANDKGAESLPANASIDFVGVYDLSVKGINDDGNIAGAVGDPVYFTDADTPQLNLKSSGTLMGYLNEALSSGATATVQVLMAKMPYSVLKVTLVAGGVAGDHTVTGITPGDRIAAVLQFTTAAAIATLADLTSEFSISAADTINNTGGTDTTDDQLQVIWEDRTA